MVLAIDISSVPSFPRHTSLPKSLAPGARGAADLDSRRGGGAGIRLLRIFDAPRQLQRAPAVGATHGGHAE